MSSPPSCPVCSATAGCPLFPSWADEERMDFLFSVYPGAMDNEQLEFWRGAMNHTEKLIMSEASVRQTFGRHGVYPLCIPRVFQVLEEEGQVEAVSASDAPPSSSSSSSSFSTSVGQLASYLVSWVWTAEEDDELNEEIVDAEESTRHWLSVGVMEKVERHLLRHLQALEPSQKAALLLRASSTDPEDVKALTLTALLQRFGFKGVEHMTGEEVRLVAVWLEKKGLAQQVRLEDGEEALLLSLTGGEGGRKPTEEAVKTDPMVARLLIKATMARIAHRVEAFTRDIGVAKRKAVELKRAGRKAEALVSLRRAKTLIGYAEKRAVVLSTLELTLDKMDEMEDNKQIFNAYNLATTTMREQRDVLGLTVEAVEGVSDALREELEVQEELGEAIAQAAPPVLAEEEENELLAELASIEESATLEEIMDMPEAPKSALPTEEVTLPEGEAKKIKAPKVRVPVVSL